NYISPELLASRTNRRIEEASDASDRRTPSERDRDRILYSSAFRRLGSVTQVVGSAEVELFHNRLTHSLKVAQVGRRLAERLVRSSDEAIQERAGGIDPDVVEAACLAHDLGHPPFGHHGEQALQGKLRNYAKETFEGNAQTFRVVTKLAIRTADHPG